MLTAKHYYKNWKFSGIILYINKILTKEVGATTLEVDWWTIDRRTNKAVNMDIKQEMTIPKADEVDWLDLGTDIPKGL